MEYLSRFISNEGLLDPLEKKVMKNGYGNIFYALSCIMHYKKTKEQIWKSRALIALKAELEIIKNRQNIQGVFRWETKNYALMKPLSG